jgi:hypothetical protein
MHGTRKKNKEKAGARAPKRRKNFLHHYKRRVKNLKREFFYAAKQNVAISLGEKN